MSPGTRCPDPRHSGQAGPILCCLPPFPWPFGPRLCYDPVIDRYSEGPLALKIKAASASFLRDALPMGSFLVVTTSLSPRVISRSSYNPTQEPFPQFSERFRRSWSCRQNHFFRRFFFFVHKTVVTFTGLLIVSLACAQQPPSTSGQGAPTLKPGGWLEATGALGERPASLRARETEHLGS